MLVVGDDGAVRSTLEVRGAAGATALAVSPTREWLVLSTPHDAQILLAAVP